MRTADHQRVGSTSVREQSPRVQADQVRVVRPAPQRRFSDLCRLRRTSQAQEHLDARFRHAVRPLCQRGGDLVELAMLRVVHPDGLVEAGEARACLVESAAFAVQFAQPQPCGAGVGLIVGLGFGGDAVALNGLPDVPLAAVQLTGQEVRKRVLRAQASGQLGVDPGVTDVPQVQSHAGHLAERVILLVAAQLERARQPLPGAQVLALLDRVLGSATEFCDPLCYRLAGGARGRTARGNLPPAEGGEEGRKGRGHHEPGAAIPGGPRRYPARRI